MIGNYAHKLDVAKGETHWFHSMCWATDYAEQRQAYESQGVRRKYGQLTAVVQWTVSNGKGKERS